MNLFENLATLSPQSESFTTLLENPNIRIERIHSNMPQCGEWYNQDHDEWILLLEGEAALEYKNTDIKKLTKGDTHYIKAHKIHRVSSTSPNTLWLAIHLL